ncbi:MAG: manganese efflux pump [Clostridiales bacterium]|nr:manganese efflux pump [Clostridiales bacterium]
MDILTLLLIACSLAMDAFAVSVGSGMLMSRARWRPTLKIAGTFGFFQALMPLIGYGVASTFAEYIQAVDHWVAFILLGFIGGKMLYDALTETEDTSGRANPCDGKNLFVMAIATSIDALAVGASFALMPPVGMLAPPVGFLFCCALIGLVTLVLCVIGVLLGCRTGGLLGKKAEIAGGVVLILIGVKILLEHTVFA